MSIPSVAAPAAPSVGTAVPTEGVSVPAPSSSAIRILGVVGAAAGLLFAGMAMWAHAAGIDYDTPGIAAQINRGFFALATAGYVGLGVGLSLARPGGSGRVARVFPSLLAASWLAILVGGFLEMFASVDPDSDVLASIGGLAQAVALIGLGVTVARAGRWSGWRRYWPLGTAAYVVGGLMAPSFFGVEPSWVVVALWALGYSGLGLALLVESLPPGRRPRSAVLLGALAIAAGAVLTVGLTTVSSAATPQAPTQQGPLKVQDPHGIGATTPGDGGPVPGGPSTGGDSQPGPISTWDQTLGGTSHQGALSSPDQ